ncbi:DUF6603 domain-containing protein [Nitrospira sp. BLG_1]|uniref:DUF6603 domain-containing protein n=1 Tax=Nitrospira sp. BLG_1 TaxID=3395883 RepID=UPI0039BCF2A1
MSDSKKPTKTKKSVVQRIVGWFVDVYLWARETLTDDQARAALLTDLGLPPTSNAKLDLPKDKLDSLQRYRAAQDVDAKAFLQAVEDLKAIADAVKAFATAVGVSGEAAIEEFSHRVFHLLALNYMRLHQPMLYWAAQPFGFIEESLTTHSTAKAYPERIVSFFKGIGNHFEALGCSLATEEQAKAFSDFIFIPVSITAAFGGQAIASAISEDFGQKNLIEVMYGWEPAPGTPPSDADRLSDGILSVLIRHPFKPPAAIGEVSEANASCSFMLVPRAHGGPGLLVAVGSALQFDLPVDDDWTFSFRVRSANAVDFLIRFDELNVEASAATDADIRVAIEANGEESNEPYVVGISERTRLEFGRLALSGELSSTGAGFKLAAADCALVIDAEADGDEFIADSLPKQETRIAFQFGLGLSSERGLYLEGGAGLRSIIPIAKSIGPVTIQHMQLGLVPDTENDRSNLALMATVAMAFDIGPLRASLDQIGFQLKLDFASRNPNLGFADLVFGFVPPKGVGLLIEGDVVSGGGFLLLDPDQGRYAGVLHLDLGGGVALKAVALLDTRLPDGQKGYSLLAIITVEGFQSIPLGFGFFLSGVGGLIGIHRTILQEPLLAGVRNHTLDHILFAEDPVRNAPALIAAVGAVFPPSKDRHLFCLMIQATYGKPALLHIHLALGIEHNRQSGSGRTSKFFVMGQIKSLLPDKDKDLIRLHMDVAGVVDFEQKTAAFDASLFDSRLARTFTIAGDMALRAQWGESPNFALAVGGFHPDFAAPVGFPKLTRVSINLSDGDNPHIRCEAYFALTSNTTQFGAKTEIFVKISKFSVHGYVSYDVLVQHDPLQFNAAFDAKVQLKIGSKNLLMVRLRGELIGPSPLHIRGSATFGFLWWDYTVSINKTLAQGEKPPIPEPVDAEALLLAALRDPANWSHELTDTDRALVTVRNAEPNTELVIHPLSRLSVRQRVLPLDREISRFGVARSSGTRLFRITEARVNSQVKSLEPVTEFFAPAQFLDMPDDQKLSGPSFERMPAGIRVGTNRVVFGASITADLDYEEIVVDSAMNVKPDPTFQSSVRLTAPALSMQVQWGAAKQSRAQRLGRAKYRSAGIAVKFMEPHFEIASTEDTSQVMVRHLTFSEAKTTMAKLQRKSPSASRFLRIAPVAELVRR